MQIKAFIKSLEEWAPLQFQESYDNAGLIVGDPEANCTGILCSLDCTEAVIEEAIQKRCNLIVSHHPIIFKGLKKLNGKNYVERVVLKENGLSVLACWAVPVTLRPPITRLYWPSQNEPGTKS